MPGETMTIGLTSSRNIFDDNSTINAVQNATVEVTDKVNNITHTLYHTTNGDYQSDDFRPEYGGKYEVNVIAEGFQPLTASSHIPYPSFVNVPEAYQGDFDDADELRELFVSLEIYSESDEQQYYVWEIIDESESGNLDFSYSDVLDNPTLLASEDSNTESILADQSFQTRVFLTDNGMKDGPIQTSFVTMTEPEAAFQFGDGSGLDEADGILITVRVMTVSKELYEYYKSVEIYRLRGTTNSSITQPVDIYSNVEGGLGIFAGLAVEDVPIRLN